MDGPVVKSIEERNTIYQIMVELTPKEAQAQADSSQSGRESETHAKHWISCTMCCISRVKEPETPYTP